MFWYMCGFSGRDNIGSSKKWKLVLEMSIIIHKYDTCKLKKNCCVVHIVQYVLVLLTYSYSRMIVWCNNPLLYCRTFRKVWKSGWARSNVVAITCPLVWIGLNDLPKSGEGGIAPSVPPRVPTALLCRAFLLTYYSCLSWMKWSYRRLAFSLGNSFSFFSLSLFF